MTPELQEALKQFMDKINAGGDFVLAEAPNVLRQMVAYGRITNLLWFPLVGFMVYLTFRLWPPMKQSWKDTNWDSEMPCVALTITSVISGGLSAVFLGIALEHAIMAWFTPALYVFNCLKDLFK